MQFRRRRSYRCREGLPGRAPSTDSPKERSQNRMAGVCNVISAQLASLRTRRQLDKGAHLLVMRAYRAACVHACGC